jgi:hypothetical protein
MKGTHYDVSSSSSHGLPKHIGSQNVAADGIVHAFAVDASLALITLITATIAITYLRPQIYCSTEFYLDCFRNKYKCWWAPPVRWVFDFIDFIMDAFFVVVAVHYLYTRRDPAPGTDTNYYIVIFSLLIAFLGFRWIWRSLFWNHHDSTTALGFSILFVFMMAVIFVILVILFGLRGDWWAFGFSIPILIWTIFEIAWTAMVVACFSRGACQPRCVQHAHRCPKAKAAACTTLDKKTSV